MQGWGIMVDVRDYSHITSRKYQMLKLLMLSEVYNATVLLRCRLHPIIKIIIKKCLIAFL